MERRRVFVIFFISMLISVLSKKHLPKAPSNGWNDNINWVYFDDAQDISEVTNRPIMLVIHKSWCRACKNLKPIFAKSTEIEELSKKFYMVNLMDDDEPEEDRYAPDGSYIPRILFIRGREVMTDVIHENGNENYKHFYNSPESILASMNKAIEMAGTPVEDFDREDL